MKEWIQYIFILKTSQRIGCRYCHFLMDAEGKPCVMSKCADELGFGDRFFGYMSATSPYI